MTIISNSTILKLVTNILQGVSMEPYKVREYVAKLLEMLKGNRINAN